MMSTKKLSVLLPVLMMGLASLACSLPGLSSEAQSAIEEQVQIAQEVEAALRATQAAAQQNVAAPQDEQQPPPADEPTLVPTLTPTATATAAAPVETGCSDRVEFVTDVTVPDGSDFDPDEHYTKTWRLRNAGSCTWTSSYDLVFSHGDAMSGPAEKALTGVVSPGQTMDLSVDLVAPAAEGGYKGYWLLRNGDGALFGLGANANVAFWVEIEVIEPGITILPLLPLQPLFPLFVSSGTGQSLADGFCFDLDAGAASSCGNAAADFQYVANMTMSGFPPTLKLTTVLDPGHGAAFVYHGGDTPSGATCQGEALNTADVDLKNGVYCYQTSDGKYGYLKVTGRTITGMTFDWGTYTFP
jgi:hypothetical protein